MYGNVALEKMTACNLSLGTKPTVYSTNTSALQITSTLSASARKTMTSKSASRFDDLIYLSYTVKKITVNLQ